MTQGNNIRSASPPSRSPQHGAHGRASLGGAGPAGGTPPPVTLLAEQPLSERIKSLRTRTRSTLLMVAGYIAVLYAGHVVVCMFIVCVQVRVPEEGPHAASGRTAPPARKERRATPRAMLCKP